MSVSSPFHAVGFFYESLNLGSFLWAPGLIERRQPPADRRCLYLAFAEPAEVILLAGHMDSP